MTEIVAAHKKIDAEFLDALEALAAAPAPNWWQDVLRNDKLFIAVRRNSLNVYYQGASIFKIDWKRKRIVPSTHVKYLVRQTQTYVSLIDGQFQHAAASLTWESYEGPETLKEMMQAAASLTEEEKCCLHPLIMGDPSVIDAEIALTRAAEEQADAENRVSAKIGDRLDAAVARNTADGPSIVFYEAKHFSNFRDLRADGDKAPPVVKQIEDYERALTNYAPALAAGYVEVARALVRIDEMRKSARDNGTTKLDPLITHIAESGIRPIIDTKPHLLIIGFDGAQRDGQAWRRHLEKLENKLNGRVRTIGKPTRKIAAFR